MPRRTLIGFLLAVAALAATAASGGAAPTVAEKRAQARQVLAELNRIDIQLGRTVEAWNGARYRLEGIRAQLAANRTALAAARASYREAQRRVAERLVALYTEDVPSSEDVILGADSLSSLVDRLETASEVSDQDRRVAGEATHLRNELAARQRRLERDRARRQAAVDELAARRAQIESSLATRQRLLASIRSKIERLKAQEAERQRRLAAEARARLERQRALAARAAQARAAQQAQAAQTAQAHEAQQTETAAPAQTTETQPAPEQAPATTAAPAPAPPAPSSTPAPVAGGHPEAATIALGYLGVPYRWGGASPSGFDCSGLVAYVFAKLGVSLPHYTGALWGRGVPVGRGELQPGDLVFFDGLSHVGIYIGGGQFVHAPHTGDVVKISSLGEGWYSSTYVGARRV